MLLTTFNIYKYHPYDKYAHKNSLRFNWCKMINVENSKIHNKAKKMLQYYSFCVKAQWCCDILCIEVWNWWQLKSGGNNDQFVWWSSLYKPKQACNLKMMYKCVCLIYTKNPKTFLVYWGIIMQAAQTTYQTVSMPVKQLSITLCSVIKQFPDWLWDDTTAACTNFYSICWQSGVCPCAATSCLE